LNRHAGGWTRLASTSDGREVRMINRSCRRLALAALLALAVAAAAFPAPASAMTLTAHTNRGGTCHLRTIASRTGTQITYGIKVNNCSTRFGVRYVVSRGILYDRTEGVPFETGYLDQKKGHLPYTNRRNVSDTDPSHAYRTRIDVSIVLKTRRDAGTPHPEHWRDPGKRCRVKTTLHDGDTLGCELGDPL
jgi:hypothetical protein